jgi:hypothetical protein
LQHELAHIDPERQRLQAQLAGTQKGFEAAGTR